MTNYVKKASLISMVLFALLLISGLCSFLVPAVFAAEADVQDETMAILDEVIGISPTEYATSLNSLVDNQFHSLAQKEVDINLVSAEGGLRVRASFVKDNLRQLYFMDYKEEYAEEYSLADTVGMAEGFLENYQNYVGDAFYGELASMLDNVDATKNTTKSTENIMLDVNNFEQIIVDYVWAYVDENGIVAKSKNVILSYDRGRLNVFLNNWPLYTVVGEPKISGEEATAIALEAAKTFSYDIAMDKGPLTVSGFDVAAASLGHESLSYLNFPDPDLARGGDPFILYPSWYVPIGFNQSYLGAVTGMTVTVWADTSEVSKTAPMVVNFPSEISADNKAITDGFNQCLTMLAVPVIVTALSGLSGVALVCKRKRFKFACSKKLFPKLFGTLMCGIIVFSAVLVATPQVTAIQDPDSKAEIYAAYYSEPEQLESEAEAANIVCATIEAAFENAEAGYIADDLSNESTTINNILTNIDYDETEFDRVSVFHFGHMAYGFGLGFQDNYGENISAATNISVAISSTKHDFVMMYVCGSAQYVSSGLAAAWTNRTDMSDDGYLDPDYQQQVYIGFCNFSPQIGNTSGTFKDEQTGPFSDWIEDFYGYALCDGYSVKQAVNLATINYDGHIFTESLLMGYEAWWPGTWNATTEKWDNRGYWEGCMKLYGDGTLHINQPRLTISATSGGYVTPSGTHRYTYGHNVSVTATAYDHYAFYEWKLDGNHYSWNNAITYAVYATHNLQAIFIRDEYRLTISAGSGGTTDPSPGNHWYSASSQAQVTADPDAHYSLDHWNLDEEYYSDNTTIWVTMNADKTLQAIFVRDEYCLTVSAGSGGTTTNPSPGSYWYDVSTQAYVTADPDEDYNFDYWLLDGEYYSDSTTVSVTMNSDQTLYAVFVPKESYTLTVLCYDQYNNPGSVALYIDGYYVGTTMDDYLVTEGQHTLEVPTQVGYHIFYAWYYDDSYHYNNPTTVSVYANKTVTACYIYPY